MTPPITGAPILEVIDAAWSVRGQSIVSDVNLRLYPGEMLGLIGPNGSGKSTLLHMMAGLLRPSRGDVRLAGQPIAHLRRQEIARRIALVAQAAETGDRISVRDAVKLGRTPWLSALRPWSSKDDEAVTAALRAVGMQALSARDWSSLSGGERQRVHIARAHAQAPQILLLDEPTNHLDIRHQIGILDLVAKLPITTVVALHDMQHALCCDRLMVLNAGRCAALGHPMAVLTPQLIRDIFDVDAELIPHPAGGRPVFSFRRLT